MNDWGGTIDDAAGEAFDKAASLLGLGYPGGPQIEKAAVGGNPKAYRLPRPLAKERDRMDMSFSGLKTALRYLVRPPNALSDTPPPVGQRLADLAASFQQAAIDSILTKVELALARTGCRALAIGGGVAANTLLRESIERLGQKHGVKVFVPPRSLCTDNAAMGAIANDPEFIAANTPSSVSNAAAAAPAVVSKPASSPAPVAAATPKKLTAADLKAKKPATATATATPPKPASAKPAPAAPKKAAKPAAPAAPVQDESMDRLTIFEEDYFRDTKTQALWKVDDEGNQGPFVGYFQAGDEDEPIRYAEHPEDE